MGWFDGRACLVFGGTSGIGRAVAERLAREGGRVAVAGRDAVRGREVVAAIEAAGGEGCFVTADVTRGEEVRGAVAACVERYGELAAAVNSAGVEGPGLPLHELDEEAFDRVLAVNLKGTWLAMRYELQRMVAAGHGAIVNVSSVNALTGAPGAGAYAAAKDAVLTLTRTAAVEAAPHGVRVNAVCPGACLTPMLERVAARLGGGSPGPALEHAAELVPAGRLADPAEIAAAVVWLLSDEASYVTGHALVADGGWSVR